MAEYKLPSYHNCRVVFHLVREDKQTLAACVDVAKTNGDVETARLLLFQECQICYAKYKRDDVSFMLSYY